jgi:1,2-phenylacetyl-CoA epoxidase PaaB subunit
VTDQPAPRGPLGNAQPVWEVFARRAYEEPLAHIGNVTADERELAVVYARNIYDEHPWIEMVVVPREALVHVIES